MKILTGMVLSGLLMATSASAKISAQGNGPIGSASLPRVAKCEFDSADDVISATQKFVGKKIFRADHTNIAMSDCEHSGYTDCQVIQNSGRVEKYFLGLWDVEVGQGAKIAGYKFKPKSEKEIHKTVCPSLRVCELLGDDNVKAMATRAMDSFRCHR